MKEAHPEYLHVAGVYAENTRGMPVSTIICSIISRHCRMATDWQKQRHLWKPQNPLKCGASGVLGSRMPSAS